MSPVSDTPLYKVYLGGRRVGTASAPHPNDTVVARLNYTDHPLVLRTIDGHRHVTTARWGAWHRVDSLARVAGQVHIRFTGSSEPRSYRPPAGLDLWRAP